MNLPSMHMSRMSVPLPFQSSCGQQNAFALPSLCAVSAEESCTAVANYHSISVVSMGHCVDILPCLKYFGWVRIWRTPRTPSSLSAPKCGVDVAPPAPLESLVLRGQVLGLEPHLWSVVSHCMTTFGPKHKGPLPSITADVNKLFRGQWVIFDSTVPQYSHCIANVRYAYFDSRWRTCMYMCEGESGDWGGRKIRFGWLLSVETLFRAHLKSLWKDINTHRCPQTQISNRYWKYLIINSVDFLLDSCCQFQIMKIIWPGFGLRIIALV